MTYLAWGMLVEGNSDQGYYEVLIPRIVEDVLSRQGLRPVIVAPVAAIRLGVRDRAIDKVAREMCDTQEAYHIFFIHADTGGRAQEEGIANRSTAYCDAAYNLCGFRRDRCIEIKPRHETEAWALCDANAVLETIGYNGNAADLGLPNNANAAEALPDPKAILTEAIVSARGGRRRGGRVEIPLAAIAQRQSLTALRTSKSFVAFEKALLSALATLGLVSQTGQN
jgi:hypothetical protein